METRVFSCLYTKQKIQRRKRWMDGRIRVRAQNRKVERCLSLSLSLSHSCSLCLPSHSHSLTMSLLVSLSTVMLKFLRGGRGPFTIKHEELISSSTEKRGRGGLCYRLEERGAEGRERERERDEIYVAYARIFFILHEVLRELPTPAASRTAKTRSSAHLCAPSMHHRIANLRCRYCFCYCYCSLSLPLSLFFSIAPHCPLSFVLFSSRTSL